MTETSNAQVRIHLARIRWACEGLIEEIDEHEADMRKSIMLKSPINPIRFKMIDFCSNDMKNGTKKLRMISIAQIRRNENDNV